MSSADHLDRGLGVVDADVWHEARTLGADLLVVDWSEVIATPLGDTEPEQVAAVERLRLVAGARERRGATVEHRKGGVRCSVRQRSSSLRGDGKTFRTKSRGAAGG